MGTDRIGIYKSNYHIIRLQPQWPQFIDTDNFKQWYQMKNDEIIGDYYYKQTIFYFEVLQEFDLMPH